MPSLRALLDPGILLGEYAFFVQRQDVAVLTMSEYAVRRDRHDALVVVEAAHKAQAIADLG
ncbi:hypothetical protein NKJ40_13130 [Mesorhizobium sp. M0119]|uniref:hypothetical protein n=1 Tax=Mesorhizobium sp. M0119 TaxID=2956885 RepID=UPI00333CFF18